MGESFRNDQPIKNKLDGVSLFFLKGSHIVSHADVYRATVCNATHGIAKAFLSVRLSVCLSICPMDCDKTKETCAQSLIPYERTFVL